MDIIRTQLADRYSRALADLDQLSSAETKLPKKELYQFFQSQCRMALDMCNHAYDPENVHMEWDAVNLLNDRYPGSLSGGLGEIALMMDSRFDTYGVPVPVLDKHGQVAMGLDFITGAKTHQVKSGIVSLTGGAIEVAPDLFDTTASYIHILTRWEGGAIWYGTSTSIWKQLLAAEVERYAGEKQPKHFTIEREDMFRLGVVELTTYDWATT